VDADSKDMKSVLTKIAANKPEVIFYPVFAGTGAIITQQARTTPGLENLNLLSADGTFTPDFYKATGKAVVGMYQTCPDLSAFGSSYQDLLGKYQKKYNEKPISAFHGHAYDAANILMDAIEKIAVKSPDGTLYIGRQALRDQVSKLKDYKGVTGNLTCDPNGDCADPRIAVYKVTQENLDKLTPPDKPFWKP
jgi:branched-chain amino acid transport system substrate-binding protein